LDGCTPKDYANHRGGTQKQFNIVVRNIKLLVRVTNRKKITVNCVITSENYKYIINVIHFCEKLGVDIVRFHQYNPIINEYKVMIVNKETINYINAILIRDDFNIDIKFNLPSKYKLGCICNQLINDRITIGLSGYITPCCHIHSNEKYGTFNNQNDNIIKLKNKFNNSTKKLELPEECQRCPRLGLSSINFNRESRIWWYEEVNSGKIKLVRKRRTG
ncbi:hypothetical protein LCGC14_2602910, partial [marine sediment metagenome]